MENKGVISKFIVEHYRHFNAATLVDAAKAYDQHIRDGKKMMIAMAGAMSTAELGKSLAEMIRQDKVQIISCTGANLEEDIMNLVANRVTDTCIPEEEAFRRLQSHIFEIWKTAEANGERYFPHEYMYKLLLSGVLEQYYEIDPKDSWMLAAAEKNLPIVVPGWEDSTMGNIFASYCIKGELKPSTVKSGIEYMEFLADWYTKNAGNTGIGFFQIGGGRFPCFTRIWSVPKHLSGVIFARLVILLPVMVLIQGLFLTKKSPGENWVLIHPNLLWSQMLPLWHH